MIEDETKEIPIWLVWVLDDRGETTLRSCDLVEEIARQHETVMRTDPTSVRVYVERSLANHLYAGMIDTRAIQNARAWTQRRTGD